MISNEIKWYTNDNENKKKNNDVKIRSQISSFMKFDAFVSSKTKSLKLFSFMKLDEIISSFSFEMFFDQFSFRKTTFFTT